MALVGHTRLELARDDNFRNIVKRVEKHNTITPYVQNAIGQGNFHYTAERGYIMPISQWFSGCLLTDKKNPETLPDGTVIEPGFCGMIAYDANITAMAGGVDSQGQGGYSGANLRRGSFDTVDSGTIAGGYQYVWTWSNSQGNGIIESVGLCRNNLGKINFTEDEAIESADNFPVDDYLGYVNCTDNLYDMFIDYENEKGYKVSYSNGVITVNVYDLNTKRLHLLGSATDIIGDPTVHTISQAIDNYASTTSSMSLTSTAIHLLTWSNGGSTINDYAISLSDWTVTARSKTFNDVTFPRLSNNVRAWTRDGMVYIEDSTNGDYVYALANECHKIVKCNLVTSLVMDIWDNPAYKYVGVTTYDQNGGGMLMPNGDWYKFGTYDGSFSDNSYAIYFHNDKPYIVKAKRGGSTYAASQGYNPNNFGTCVRFARYNSNTMLLSTLFGNISTVNNLSEPIIKSPDLTMRLTYSITEQ